MRIFEKFKFYATWILEVYSFGYFLLDFQQ